ncbi:MAG: hypothetical protein AMXMBFR79_13890 [Chitinophagaceae bacterium]|nr:hypothetical protein [Chitinophagales bacterium]
MLHRAVFLAREEKINLVCAPAIEIDVIKICTEMNKVPKNWLLFSVKNSLNETVLQRQTDFLDKVLFERETFHRFCLASEILDINRCKIYTQQSYIRNVVSLYYTKPFVFIFCKN